MPTAETSTVLDEAFQRMAACGFELPNGFVNHGAMACEALAALGFESEITTWAAGNGADFPTCARRKATLLTRTVRALRRTGSPGREEQILRVA